VASAFPKINVVCYLVKDGKVSKYASNKVIAEEVHAAARSIIRKRLYE
jgi:hypothetical protein